MITNSFSDNNSDIASSDSLLSSFGGLSIKVERSRGESSAKNSPCTYICTLHKNLIDGKYDLPLNNKLLDYYF